MSFYWVTFTDGTAGTCWGANEYDAAQIAAKVSGKAVAGEKYKPDARPLPYPARPVIWQLDHPVHGKTPDFCLHGAKCAGCTSCPRPYSCVE